MATIKQGSKNKPRWDKLVRTASAVGLGLVMFSTITNITKQIVTLIKAGEENAKLEKRLVSLRMEEKELKDKIKAASESSYREGLRRELLGEGNENDYWIIMPSEFSLDEVYPKETKVEEKSNLSQWWRMFTD